MKFVSVGECMVELGDRGNDLYGLAVGGDTLNTAWYARALLPANAEVDYVTALGDDPYSDIILERFRGGAIGVGHIARVAGHRPGLYLIRQINNDRQFTYWRGQSAARQLMRFPEILEQAFKGTDIVYFSGITLAILPLKDRHLFLELMKEARNSGSTIAFDPNVRPALWSAPEDMREAIKAAAKIANTVLPTLGDEHLIHGDRTPEHVAAQYLEAGASEVVVKDGANSAFLATPAAQLRILAIAGVEAIDPTGAGDSFNGAYLAARMQQYSPEEAVRLGHEVASQVVRYRGALMPQALLSSSAKRLAGSQT